MRTVFLSGNPQKATVSEDLHTVGDPDTLFPLQAALAHSIAQSLFLSRWTLIVEGLTEFWLLKALHSVLAGMNDGDALGEGIAILPAGGTALIAPLGSMMLGSRARPDGKMLVLLNADHADKDAARQLERVFGDTTPVMTVAGLLGVEEAMVDDLVLRDAYAAAAQKAYDKMITLNAAEVAVSTNAQAMDLVFRRNSWGRFGANGRASTALWLAAHWADARNISSLTLDRARKLFREINRRSI